MNGPIFHHRKYGVAAGCNSLGVYIITLRARPLSDFGLEASDFSCELLSHAKRFSCRPTPFNLHILQVPDDPNQILDPSSEERISCSARVQCLLNN